MVKEPEPEPGWFVIGINPNLPGYAEPTSLIWHRVPEGLLVAVCGVRPTYGWSFDLYADFRRCKRCVAGIAAGKLARRSG